MRGEPSYSTVDDSTHNLAILLGVSDYSVDHARQDLNIHRHGPLTDIEKDQIVKYKNERDAEYRRIGVLDKAPEGYFLTTHDVIRMMPTMKQGQIVSAISIGQIKGVRVKTMNGYCWMCSPESVKKYSNDHNKPLSKDTDDIISNAIARDIRHSIWYNEDFQFVMRESNLGFMETLNSMLKMARKKYEER